MEPHYNEVLGTMKITSLYQVFHYIGVKKQRNIKSWDQQNYLVIRGFCYIRPLYNEVPLYWQKKKSINLEMFIILYQRYKFFILSQKSLVIHVYVTVQYFPRLKDIVQSFAQIARDFYLGQYTECYETLFTLPNQAYILWRPIQRNASFVFTLHIFFRPIKTK